MLRKPPRPQGPDLAPGRHTVPVTCLPAWCGPEPRPSLEPFPGLSLWPGAWELGFLGLAGLWDYLEAEAGPSAMGCQAGCPVPKPLLSPSGGVSLPSPILAAGSRLLEAASVSPWWPLAILLCWWLLADASGVSVLAGRGAALEYVCLLMLPPLFPVVGGVCCQAGSMARSTLSSGYRRTQPAYHGWRNFFKTAIISHFKDGVYLRI